jgi:hypothetical protein
MKFKQNGIKWKRVGENKQQPAGGSLLDNLSPALNCWRFSANKAA